MKAHPELLLRWPMRVRESFLRENKKSIGMRNEKLRRASHYLSGEESAEIPVRFSFQPELYHGIKKSPPKWKNGILKIFPRNAFGGCLISVFSN
jgi:hypothetical protein